MRKHLSLKDRIIIQYQIEHYQALSLKSLALALKCHASSVYRELKRNRLSQGSKHLKFLKERPPICVKLKQFPYVCNTCSHKIRCSKEIFVYDAYEADRKATHVLRETRSKPKLSPKALKQLDAWVSPGVIKGQSLYHILQSDNRIQVSESSLRRYIDRQYLMCRNIDLPRTVRFPNAKTSRRVPRKRINIEFLVNRTYQDYIDYNQSSKRVVIQIDTVIGKSKDKKCLLTLFEPSSKFQWGYILYRTSTAVNHCLTQLIQSLYQSQRLFFDCMLSDNGSEFQSLPLLETTPEGEILTRVFFCDPYSSFQKGACEHNHSLIRYLIRKGESLDFITQDEINQLFSHINSQKRKSLSGKTPFQAFYQRFHFYPSEFIPVFEISPSQIKLRK